MPSPEAPRHPLPYYLEDTTALYQELGGAMLRNSKVNLGDDPTDITTEISIGNLSFGEPPRNNISVTMRPIFLGEDILFYSFETTVRIGKPRELSSLYTGRQIVRSLGLETYQLGEDDNGSMNPTQSMTFPIYKKGTKHTPFLFVMDGAKLRPTPNSLRRAEVLRLISDNKPLEEPVSFRESLSDHLQSITRVIPPLLHYIQLPQPDRPLIVRAA